MLIENDNRFHTLYLVVRLSTLDLKTWILSFSFETITENENGYRFRLALLIIHIKYILPSICEISMIY